MVFKHFKVIGPKTTREFDINEDEMVTWSVIKIKDHENKIEGEAEAMDKIKDMQQPMMNENIYPTKDSDLI